MNALQTNRLTIRPVTPDDLHAAHLRDLDLPWAVGMIENTNREREHHE